MKRKIIRFLCRVGWVKLAYKISPSLVAEWQGEQLANAFKDALDRIGHAATVATVAMSKFAESINEEVKDDWDA